MICVQAKRAKRLTAFARVHSSSVGSAAFNNQLFPLPNPEGSQPLQRERAIDAVRRSWPVAENYWG